MSERRVPHHFVSYLMLVWMVSLGKTQMSIVNRFNGKNYKISVALEEIDSCMSCEYYREGNNMYHYCKRFNEELSNAHRHIVCSNYKEKEL